MNNLKYYNDSLAYDFNMFMPKPAVEASPANIVKMPKAQSRPKAKRNAAKTLSVSFASVVTAAVLVLGLCSTIVLRTQVNEVNSRINSVKSEINELDSVETSLMVEYGRRISYANLEEDAIALGMRKSDKEQVVYICVNDSAVARNGKGEIIE